MPYYHLSQKYPHSEFLQVEVTFTEIARNSLSVSARLPTWRPGRYQLGNFAKNIRNFIARDEKGNTLDTLKQSPHHWKILLNESRTVKISYEYFTSEIDGGSTYVDEEQWYLNFINCMIYLENQLEVKCEIELAVPNEWEIAAGLAQKGKTLFANTFYQLVDSPVIASQVLKKLQYNVNGIDFNLWFKGDIQLTYQDKILSDFEKFTQEQINTMGDFESDSYHFLFQIPDQKAYHGVEHLNSTCIVLGPAKEFNNEEFYDNFLGISSHELFHYWNIIRIRPEEMFPYNFTRENYFSTGYVAEGVTTYYGDLFLVRSGVKTIEWYQEELNKLLKRHFDNFGRHNYSVANSSMDLWIDGYEAGTPDRKVSIYVKGAIIALLLDLQIMIESKGEKSLDDVMRYLWSNYYKKNKGYSPADYLKVAELVLGDDLSSYKIDFIEGTVPVEGKLAELLPEFGFELIEKYPENSLAKRIGLKYTENQEGFAINRIAPGSVAEKVFRRGDIIISIDNKDIKNLEMQHILDLDKFTIHFMRNGKMKKTEIHQQVDEKYFAYYELKKLTTLTEKQMMLRRKWLKA
ncbi:M61 family metallopeptidase [Marivirga sp. S37H4]|uniref:M61 family metallopeptidase n=1 Tax=Marivirga aurantiaca TaxID=2802615 RepID=A0A934X1N3_9BACT|nr:PDZ domain-containing protein [Marivirga aurantiaca]MBK6266675.1 M61 family metallopeptidase [Marivirga aurantiaca]